MFDRISQSSWFTATVLSVGLIFALPVTAQTVVKAGAASRVVEQVDDAKRVTLPGSVVSSVRKATDLGAAPASNPANRMVLLLQPSDAQRKGLAALVEAQHTKGSDTFHKWLTPAEFGTRFGPSSDDVAKVSAWLQSKGFTGVEVSHSGQTIEFSGTVGTVQSAFGTSIHRFQTKTASGAVEQHTANVTPISIPAALAPVVAGALSLNDFHSRPMHVDFGTATRNAAGKMVRTKGDSTSTDGNGNFSYAVAPADLRKIYGGDALPAGIDGTGTSIAIIGRSDVQLTDIQNFRAIFGLPENDPNFIISGTDPGMNNGNDAGESTLDLEWAGAIAPKATINFITAASTDVTDGIALSALYAVNNVVSPIMTVSYGSCEMHNGPGGNQFWSGLWEQAAAEGISVFVSSGDGGAATCDADEGNSPAVLGDSVNALASTPYNVAVGGTQFAEGGNYMQYWDSNNEGNFLSALGYIPEAAWNESCDPTQAAGPLNCVYGQTYYVGAGGGGGRSNCAYGTEDSAGNVTCTGGYAKPSWQTGAGVPADNVRDVPDVALNSSGADDPYLFCFESGCQYTVTNGVYSLTAANLVGGTSVASPIMAGIMSLVEQKNGQWQGQPNYTLYNLAAASNASCSSSSRTDPTQPASCIFNDVTVGNNSVPGLPGYGTSTADFTTTAGYDLATGLGSVNIANLVADWGSTTPAASTTTTLSTTVTTAKHGSAIPMSAAVTSASATPGGDLVLLTDKYGAGDAYTLDSTGKWSGNAKDLPGGTYNLTARYAGNAAFATSTSAGVPLTITPEDSAHQFSTLVFNTNNFTYVPGTQSPYFGATVYMKDVIAGLSGQGVVTGTASVLVDGTTTLVSGAVAQDGEILLSSTDIPVGTHALTFQYSGDNSFNASTSAPITVTIPKGQSVTYPNPVGGPNSLTLAVISVSGTVQPTGTAQLWDNGVAFGPPQPVVYTGIGGDGTAQINTSHTYTPGQHIIQATYSGDSNYDPVALNSNFAYQRTLNFGPSNGTAVSITSFTMTNAATLSQGSIATFNVSVVAKTPNGVGPTGQVDIYDGNNEIASATLVNGKGSGISYMDYAGDFNLRAEYEGDTNFASSLSANTIKLSVPKLTPAITFTTSEAFVLPNSQVSLNFTGTGQKINPFVEQDPTGTVTFSDAVNGGTAQVLGTFPIGFVNGMTGGYSGRFTLPTGTNVLTAAYSGNPNFFSASATSTVVVGDPGFTISSTQSSLVVNAGAPSNVALALSPTLGFTGTAALTCSGGLPAGSTCAFSSSSLTFGGAQTSTLTVTTPAASPSASASLANSGGMKVVAASAFAGLLLLCVPRRRRMVSLLGLLLAVTVPFVGCGGSNQPKATLLSVSSSSIKAASGSSVSLVANLDALAEGPTGTITFYDGKTAIGSAVTLSGNVATLQTASLTVGAHSITAVYSGDTKNDPSTSGAISEVITGTTTLQVSATAGSIVQTLSIPLTLQ